MSALPRSFRLLAALAVLAAFLSSGSSVLSQMTDGPIRPRLEAAVKGMLATAQIDPKARLAAVLPLFQKAPTSAAWVVSDGGCLTSAILVSILSDAGCTVVEGAELRRVIGGYGRGPEIVSQPDDGAAVGIVVGADLTLSGSIRFDDAVSKKLTVNLKLFGGDGNLIRALDLTLLSGTEYRNNTIAQATLKRIGQTEWSAGSSAWVGRAAPEEVAENEIRLAVGAAWRRIAATMPAGRIGVMPIWKEDATGQSSRLSLRLRDALHAAIGQDRLVSAKVIDDKVLMEVGEFMVLYSYDDDLPRELSQAAGLAALLSCRYRVVGERCQVDLRLVPTKGPTLGSFDSVVLPSARNAGLTAAVFRTWSQDLEGDDQALRPIDPMAYLGEVAAREAVALVKSKAKVLEGQSVFVLPVLLPKTNLMQKRIDEQWDQLLKRRAELEKEALDKGSDLDSLLATRKLKILNETFACWNDARDQIVGGWAKEAGLTAAAGEGDVLSGKTDAALRDAELDIDFVTPRASQNVLRIVDEDQGPAEVKAAFYLRPMIVATKSTVVVRVEILSAKGKQVALSRARPLPTICTQAVLEAIEAPDATLPSTADAATEKSTETGASSATTDGASSTATPMPAAVQVTESTTTVTTTTTKVTTPLTPAKPAPAPTGGPAIPQPAPAAPAGGGD